MSRNDRPLGWMVYGSPEGTGRFVPAETRWQAARRKYAAWSSRSALENGQALLYCVLWTAVGVASLVFGWHKLWEVAPIAVGVTAIAAFGRSAAAGLRARTRKRRQ